MYKRTKGYLLLAMLVITGLAGRLHSVTLSGKERSFAIKELKGSKADFLISIEGLSSRQLAFRPAKNALTIKDYICEATCLQKRLWLTLQNLVKKPAGNKIYTNAVHDDRMVPAITDSLLHDNQLVNLQKPVVSCSLTDFKNGQADFHRFAKTTTEDLRAYTCPTKAGTIDAYQLILVTAAGNRYFTERIQQLKSSPRFPK